jgi:hypothetical protein
MANKRTFETEEMIDYIILKIKAKYPREFSDVTFGELPNYTPEMFQGPRGTTLPLVAVSPVYDRLVENTRTPASEVRARGVDIVTIVNILPEMQAKPPEKLGERILTRHTQYLINFLGSSEMVTLDGHAEYAAIGDINNEWLVGDKLVHRASRIQFIVFARLNRKPPLHS